MAEQVFEMSVLEIDKRSLPGDASGMSKAPELIDVRIRSVTYEAEGINSYELRRPDGRPLGRFSAGSHVDVHLANGLIRSYSLCNASSETGRYVIAVAKDRGSRGGSLFVHERWRAGDIVRIGAPRNNFPLDETASHSVLIAGGIGITPLLAMARRLGELGKSWELYHCTRTSAQAAFRDELRRLGADRVRTIYDHEPGQKMLDLTAVVASASAETHFYCCGPQAMLAAFEAATTSLPPERVHIEYFSPRTLAEPASGSFVAELSRSGMTFEIPEDKSILDVLLEAGFSAPHSCQEGVCGACETRVLAGLPEHRDSVLTQSERASGKIMMICCSRSLSGRLVLDL